MIFHGLPLWLSGKESACSAGGMGLIPESGRSSGGGHGSPLQCFCLENPMNRGAWWATVQGLQRVGHNLSNKCTHSHIHMVSLCPY